MTERSLMIRHALAGRYFAIGMDFPSARVFDVATGSLAAVVEVPPRSRTSLAVVSLTALTLGDIREPLAAEEQGTALEVVGVSGACYAAVGLSNGTVLLHNVSKDEFVQHLAVSDTQQPITAAAFCGRYLFCVAANRSLCVVDCLRGERVKSQLRVQHDAGAIAVMQYAEDDAANGSLSAGCAFLIFVSGPTNAVYTLRLHSEAAQTTGATMERLVSFASQASRADFAWLGGTMQHPIAVTASAQEGVVRVWDACATVSSQTTSSRCRRSLLCGQRILDISVHSPATVNTATNGYRGGAGKGEAFVAATTFTGAVLVWNLGSALLAPLADPVPTPPTLRIVSKESSARLLFGAFIQGGAAGHPSLLVLRGRFAVPHFEVVDLREAARRASSAAPTASALATEGALYEMPAGPTSERTGGIDAVHADMEVLDHAWATHCRQQQQQQRLAARAIATPSEGFVSPVAFHATSVKDIPQKALTLEQRLKRLSLSSAAPSQQWQQQQQQQQQQHALGLATVPLYQALHASDASAVMELLTVASRSADDIRATVMGLQLPYCLQLLQILSQRVRGATSRSPLFLWIDAIVHYRGVEMYHAQQLSRQQQQQKQGGGEGENEERRVSLGTGGKEAPDPLHPASTTAAAPTASPSPPKDFVAPLLHQYRNMTALYDPLAAMYGRLSIFKSVRPSERGVFVNTDAGIIFPAMFTEIRCAGGEYRTMRVRSKRDPNSRRNKKRGAVALLRKARRMAAAEAAEAAAAKRTSADDVASDAGDELDMDALDQMRLEDDTSGGDEEDSDADAGPGKRPRGDQTEMIAEADRGSSYGVESPTRSSEAEFDTASDDDVNSAAAEDDDEEEEEDSSSSSTDRSSSGVNTTDMLDEEEYDDDDDDDEDDDDDDGMGDDMAELLEAQNEDKGPEGRRHKRVRTDH